LAQKGSRPFAWFLLQVRPSSRYRAAPDSPTPANTHAVFAARWSESALYHAVAVIALFNFMNRLVEGIGIELDPNYVKPASERLAERGYLPLIEMMKRQMMKR
jgi:hypothetical protein